MPYQSKYLREFVYGLVDPETKQVRYVGKAGDPRERYYQITSRARVALRKGYTDRLTPADEWVAELIANDQLPELIIFAEIPRHEILDVERAFISVFSAYGDIVNIRGNRAPRPPIPGESELKRMFKEALEEYEAEKLDSLLKPQETEEAL
jgi:hypothetical protein